MEGRTWSRTSTPTFEMYRALEPGENISITVNGTAQLLYYSAGSSVEDYLLQIQSSLSANNISSTIDGHSLITTGYDPATMHISCSPEIGGFEGFGDGYRFGFQNQEQDEELWEGAVTFKYRVEDPRLGRFFSVDPLNKDYPWNSNYAFCENRVIDSKELEGLEKVEYWVDGKCLETFSWDKVDRATQEAFLRKHDIEGAFGMDYHPEDSQFSNPKSNEIWRFYPTYCENTTGMLLVRYSDENAVKSGKGTTYSLSGLVHSIATFSYNLNGSSAPANGSDLTDKQARILKNTALIVGGVITIVVTAGTATPGVLTAAAATLEGFTIVSGTMATVGGTAKMVLDLKGDFKNSDKVPTGYLGATIGSTLTVTTDNGETVQNIKGFLTVVEGGLTFSPRNWSDLGQLSGKAFTITNVCADGDFQQGACNVTQEIKDAIDGK